MADVNVLDLTDSTPGSGDSLILFDRTTGDGKSTQFNTLKNAVLNSKFGDSSPASGDVLEYDPSTGKYKNSTALTSLKETFTNNGAHNLFDLSTYTLKNATFTLTNTGIRIQSESDGTSRRVSFLLSNIKKNTNFIFSSSVIETSGESWLVIKNVDTSYNIVDKALTAGDNTVNFNTGSANSLYIILYCTHNTSATGDVTYNNLMIRLASDTDSTYQPYAATNQQLTGLISNDFTNGAVNLLPNKVSSQVINGITFTVNSDGTVIVNASSAASADTKLTFINKTILEEIRQRAGGRIKFCGCPSGGSASSYVIYAHTESNKYPIDIGQGAILDEATVDGLAIQIKSGYQPTNLVFKPMITLADMPNSDYNHYVPYAISNASITKSNNNVSSSTITTLGNTTTFDLTNATVETIVNAFTRRISIKAEGLVTKAALTAGQAVSIANVSSGYYGLIVSTGIAYGVKDSTVYNGHVGKNKTNTVLSFTAHENIPIGTTIYFYMEWPY